jgi:hypothetical protein
VAVTSDVLETDLAADRSSFVVHAAFDAPTTATVTVTLTDAEGGTATYPIPVAVASVGWKPDVQWSGATNPVAREHGTFLFDESTNTAFLMMGSGYAPQGTALGDFWAFDVASSKWTQITPTGDVPPPTASGRAVTIPQTTTAYMFGGYNTDGTTVNNDLYRIDFGGGRLVFTKVMQQSPPSARSLHGLGYDPMTQTFVVFGGYSWDAGPVNDTWTMQLSGTTAQWTQQHLTAGPSPRYGFFYGTDMVAGRFIVFSGAQPPTAESNAVNAAKDTWALDLRATPPAWSMVLDGTEMGSPTGRRNGCFVVNPRGPTLYVFGGTPDELSAAPGLWALDMRPGHEAFTSMTLPAEPIDRASNFGFYNPVTDTVSCGFGNTLVLNLTDLASFGP